MWKMREAAIMVNVEMGQQHLLDVPRTGDSSVVLPPEDAPVFRDPQTAKEMAKASVESVSAILGWRAFMSPLHCGLCRRDTSAARD